MVHTLKRQLNKHTLPPWWAPGSTSLAGPAGRQATWRRRASASTKCPRCCLGRAAGGPAEPVLPPRGPQRLQARQRLLAWYDAHHRVLPWRLNRHSGHQRGSPLAGLSRQELLYRAWVSEVCPPPGGSAGCQGSTRARAACRSCRSRRRSRAPQSTLCAGWPSGPPSRQAARQPAALALGGAWSTGPARAGPGTCGAGRGERPVGRPGLLPACAPAAGGRPARGLPAGRPRAQHCSRAAADPRQARPPRAGGACCPACACQAS